MINPANYYNPFAKYNYVSKTRGIYMPKETEPLLKDYDVTLKSTSIYSTNYDAEADINEQLKLTENKESGIWQIVHNLIFKNKS